MTEQEKPKRPDIQELEKIYRPTRTIYSSVILDLITWIRYLESNIVKFVADSEKANKEAKDEAIK